MHEIRGNYNYNNRNYDTIIGRAMKFICCFVLKDDQDDGKRYMWRDPSDVNRRVQFIIRIVCVIRGRMGQEEMDNQCTRERKCSFLATTAQ